MTRFVPTCLLLVLCLSLSFAQNALHRYYAPELRAVPGVIDVSSGYLTTLEFFGPVQNVYSGRQENLDISVEGSKVFLGAKVLDGSTDLQVEVEGTTLLFKLAIFSPGDGPKLYEVLRDRPSPLMTNPALRRPPSRSLRRTLDFQVMGVTPPNRGKGTVFFTFSNHSSGVINLDTARPRVTQFGAALPYEVSKEPLRQLVEPGELQTGFIAVTGLQPGPAELSWPVTEMQGETREVTFRETLDVPNASY